MNVWAKMITALRGGAHEMGEAVVDGQALRILDQELRDAAEEVRKKQRGFGLDYCSPKVKCRKVCRL